MEPIRPLFACRIQWLRKGTTDKRPHGWLSFRRDLKARFTPGFDKKWCDLNGNVWACSDGRYGQSVELREDDFWLWPGPVSVLTLGLTEGDIWKKKDGFPKQIASRRLNCTVFIIL